MVLSLALSFLALTADAKTLSKRAVIASNSRDPTYAQSLGSAYTLTTINQGVSYWLSGGGTHNIYGNLNNYGRLTISQTDYSLPIYGGQTCDFVGHDANNGNLNNYAGASILLNDVSANSAATYDWYLNTFDNEGSIQWCSNARYGGSTYQLYCTGSCTNNGLIVFEQVNGVTGTSAVWRNDALQPSSTTPSANIYNNGGFLMRDMRVDFVQNPLGNGCWMIDGNAVMYLQDGVGAFQNPGYGPSMNGQSIAFLSNTGILHMDTAVYSRNSNFGARIYGFKAGNALEFYESILSFTYTSASGILSIQMYSGNTANLNIGSGYVASGFSKQTSKTFYAAFNAIVYSSGAPNSGTPAQCQLTAPTCSALPTSGFPGGSGITSTQTVTGTSTGVSTSGQVLITTATPATAITSTRTVTGPSTGQTTSGQILVTTVGAVTATSIVYGPMTGITTSGQVLVTTALPSTSYTQGPVAGTSTTGGLVIVTTTPGNTATRYTPGPTAGTTTSAGIVIITTVPQLTATSYTAGPSAGTTTSGGVVVITTTTAAQQVSTSYTSGPAAGTTTSGNVVVITTVPAITGTSYTSGSKAGTSTTNGIVIITTVPSVTATSYTTGPTAGTTTSGGVVVITSLPTITATSYTTGTAAGTVTTSGVLVITTVPTPGSVSTSYVAGPSAGTTTSGAVIVVTTVPAVTATSFTAGPTAGSTTSSGTLIITTVPAQDSTSYTTGSIAGTTTSGNVIVVTSVPTVTLTSYAAGPSAGSTISSGILVVTTVPSATGATATTFTNGPLAGSTISSGILVVTTVPATSSTVNSATCVTPSVSATPVSGYGLEWSGLNSAANGPGYLTSTVGPVYDINGCAAACSARDDCQFFNVYQEYQSCNVFRYICVLWNQDQPQNTANNVYNNGKPISNSAGYLKGGNTAPSSTATGSTSQTPTNSAPSSSSAGQTSVSITSGSSVSSISSTISSTSTAIAGCPTVTGTTPAGYNLEWSGQTSAANCAGYVYSYVMPSYDVAKCSATCDSQSSCVFFNIYQDLNGGAYENVCVTWSQDQPLSCATNSYNNGKPICNSSGYQKGSSGSSSSLSATASSTTSSSASVSNTVTAPGTITSSTSTASGTTPSSATSVATTSAVPGYTVQWQNQPGAATCQGYLFAYTETTKDVNACANSCNTTTSCVFFNIYAEVSNGVTDYVCALWSQNQGVQCASNSYNGGKPVSGSDGYLKNSATSTSQLAPASTCACSV